MDRMMRVWIFMSFVLKLTNTMTIDYHLEDSNLVPSFDKSFENITVKIGQQAILPCFISNLGTYKVIWTKSGDILTLGNVKINTDTRLNVQHRYLSEWHLIIDNVVTDDEGEYYCKTNGDYFKIVNLHVFVAPSIDDFKSTPAGTLTIKEDASLSLKCFADGKPEPQVKWYRWKKFKKSISDKIELGENGNEIFISSIMRNDENVYECIAKNSVPPATSRIFNIDVQFLPNVELNIRKTYQFLSKKVSFECRIQANPLARSYWLKNGQTITNHNNQNAYSINTYDVNELHTSVSMLTIESINAHDFGEYQCCAENSFGTICSNIFLHEIVEQNTSSNKKISSSSTTTTQVTSLRHTSSFDYLNNNDDESISNIIYEDDDSYEIHKTSYEVSSDEATSSSNAIDSKDKRQRHNLIKTKEFIQIEPRPISSQSRALMPTLSIVFYTIYLLVT